MTQIFLLHSADCDGVHVSFQTLWVLVRGQRLVNKMIISTCSECQAVDWSAEPKFGSGFHYQGGSHQKQIKMEAVVQPAESLNRARTARQGIMGPFNLAWKTWVILAGGFAPDQHSDSNFVHVCLSANPPIEIYPRLCHSSWVLAARGGWGCVDSRLPKQARGFSGKETKVTQAYIPTWTPNNPNAAAVATFLWKSSIPQVFSANAHLLWRDNRVMNSSYRMQVTAISASSTKADPPAPLNHN